MDPNKNESSSAPVTPEVTPAPSAAAPIAPTTPPVTPEPAPAAPVAAPPVEGQSATPVAPAAEPVAPVTPEPPRESAIARRARELRERAAGQTALADRLDPPTIQAPQPQPPLPQPLVAAPAPTAPASQSTPLPDYYDPETGDIDVAKMNAYNERRAREIAAEIVQSTKGADEVRTARTNYVNSLLSDAQAIASTYDEMNPSKPDAYDKELDDHIEAAYRLATTDAEGKIIRTDISLKEFADKEIKLYRKQAAKYAAGQPNSVAAQALDTAAAPGSTKPTTDKPFKDLTLAEKRAKLGYVVPPTVRIK